MFLCVDVYMFVKSRTISLLQNDSLFRTYLHSSSLSNYCKVLTHKQKNNHDVCVHAFARACVRACVCVCACVRERERERERERDYFDYSYVYNYTLDFIMTVFHLPITEFRYFVLKILS